MTSAFLTQTSQSSPFSTPCPTLRYSLRTHKLASFWRKLKQKVFFRSTLNVPQLCKCTQFSSLDESWFDITLQPPVTCSAKTAGPSQRWFHPTDPILMSHPTCSCATRPLQAALLVVQSLPSMQAWARCRRAADPIRLRRRCGFHPAGCNKLWYVSSLTKNITVFPSMLYPNKLRSCVTAYSTPLF